MELFPQLIQAGSNTVFRSLLIVLFLCVNLVSCSIIPEHEQFISASIHAPVVRSSGSCLQGRSTYDEYQSRSRTSELNPQKISILDWNIYKEQGPDWERDLLDLAADKDIILLQEASMSEKLKQTLAQKNLFWNFNSAFKYRGIENSL